MPNFLDLNLDPTTTVPMTITVSDTSGKRRYPMERSTLCRPTPNTATLGLFGQWATNFQNITEVVSNVNSTYNALVAEVQNRSIHDLQFDFNFTWAHALDFAQNATTTTSLQIRELAWTPTPNARANYGNSNYNVPIRFVGYALYTFPVHPLFRVVHLREQRLEYRRRPSRRGPACRIRTAVSGFNSNDAIRR